MWLGGDDGERMVASGMERVLAIDPLYEDAWTDWLTLFRNAGPRRHLAELLSPYRAHPVIRSRLALLAIEDERYDDANQLLDSALAVDSTNTAWLALRAQSAFEAGRHDRGWSLYRRALSHADLDSTDALWRQAIGIAWPYEVKFWEAGVPPDTEAGLAGELLGAPEPQPLRGCQPSRCRALRAVALRPSPLRAAPSADLVPSEPDLASDEPRAVDRRAAVLPAVRDVRGLAASPPTHAAR